MPSRSVPVYRADAHYPEHAKLKRHDVQETAREIFQEIDDTTDKAAMRLMLLRHAKAVAAEPGMADRDRGLTPRGRNDALKIGSYMAHHALLPTYALVSSARRTRETWERLLTAFPEACPSDFLDELYDARSEDILTAIREVDGSCRNLLVIGHNPGIHEVARLLIASGEVEAREQLNEGLPTSGLAIIDFAGHNWDQLRGRGGRLERFISPRLIKMKTD
jgi:phosphohistidine phosphatase